MRRSGAARRHQTLPVREKARQRVLFHWFHFAAQFGQRLSANLPQNLRIAPLAMQTAGTKTALEDAAVVRKLAQRILHRARIQRKTVRGLTQRERPMRPRIPAHKLQQGMRHRLEQRSCQTRRQRNSKAVAIARGIFSCDQALLAGDAQLQQATRADEPVDMREQVKRNDPAAQLVARKIAEAQAQIVDSVG